MAVVNGGGPRPRNERHVGATLPKSDAAFSRWCADSRRHGRRGRRPARPVPPRVRSRSRRRDRWPERRRRPAGAASTWVMTSRSARARSGRRCRRRRGQRSRPRRCAAPRHGRWPGAVSSDPVTTAPGSARPGWREATMLRRFGSGLPPKLSKVLRPMTSGLPAVVARKCAMSDFSRQSRRLSRPMRRSRDGGDEDDGGLHRATSLMGLLASMVRGEAERERGAACGGAPPLLPCWLVSRGCARPRSGRASSTARRARRRRSGPGSRPARWPGRACRPSGSRRSSRR